MKVWTERIEGIGANGEENEQTVKASYTAYLIDNNPEEAEKKRKAIIICPGGGYRFVSPREAEPIALEYLAMGYHAFVLSYSVAPSRFPQAIEAVFPQTEIQQCIIHQIRNTTKFVSYKEIKPLMADLKRVYAAPTEEVALAELDSFDEKWSGKYPKIAKSWKDNWANLSTYFKYPEAVRRLIYTTNTIEGFNRQLRKVTKSKTVFPSDDSLLKMLYLAMIDITKKWTGHRQDWGQIHSQLEIFFEERLERL